MGLTSAVQESLVTMLCYSERGRIVAGLVPPGFFDPFYKDIAEHACDFLYKYNKIPGDHTLDIIDQLSLLQPDKEEVYRQIFSSMLACISGLNEEYILACATSFVREQSLKAGLGAAIDALKSKDEHRVDKAESILTKAMTRVNTLFEPGVVVSDGKALSFLDDEDSCLLTGIKELDTRGLGPARKKLHIFLAPPSRGKSWWLIHLGKMAMLSGHRVLYLSLEMSENEVCQRYMQSLFSVTKRKELIDSMRFVRDDLGRFLSFNNVRMRERPALEDESIYKFLASKQELLRNKPPIIVKQFPTGSLTAHGIESYLDSLEIASNFIPDLILVDYADIMKLGSTNYRIELGNLYKDLRGIAVKRNIAMATASQTNRAGAHAKVIDETHIAEDFSKVGIADNSLSYNQTKEEHELGLARLFVLKARGDQGRFNILISQAYTCGQFCLDSVRMDSSYWDKLSQAVEDEVSDVPDDLKGSSSGFFE